MKFEKRVVLITGASEGIGRALAIEFAKEGAETALVARSTGSLQRLGKVIRGMGRQSLELSCDVTHREALEQAIDKTVTHYGRLDILVNNAGIGLYSPLENVPVEDFERMMTLNFWAVFWAVQKALPYLEKHGDGRIINISSILGRLDFPWMGPYCISKHAVNSLSNALRMELRGRAVEVMTVCPGRVRTSFQDHSIKYGPIHNPPGGGSGLSPQEVARAVVTGAWKHRREIVIPRLGWALVYLQQVWPRLGDRLAMRFSSRSS